MRIFFLYFAALTGGIAFFGFTNGGDQEASMQGMQFAVLLGIYAEMLK